MPLRITRGSGGGFRVIDGHRRLAAAVGTGLAEVPADLAEDRAGDEPGQHLDMRASHRHRAPLTLMEEADSLTADDARGSASTSAGLAHDGDHSSRETEADTSGRPPEDADSTAGQAAA